MAPDFCFKRDFRRWYTVIYNIINLAWWQCRWVFNPVFGDFFPLSVVSCIMSLLWLSEVDCGSPPALPHSDMLWNKSTTMGTEVIYQCNYGYHNVGKGNKSICTAAGQWKRPSILCQGTVTVFNHIILAFWKTLSNYFMFSLCPLNFLNWPNWKQSLCPCYMVCCMFLLVETFCGSPPIIESTEQVWNNNSTPGSTVLYFCKEGFYNKGGHNVSVCNEYGQWTTPTLTCQGKYNEQTPEIIFFQNNTS